jgi:hypothetical protein
VVEPTLEEIVLAYLREQQPKTPVLGQPPSGNLGGDTQ